MKNKNKNPEVRLLVSFINVVWVIFSLLAQWKFCDNFFIVFPIITICNLFIGHYVNSNRLTDIYKASITLESGFYALGVVIAAQNPCLSMGIKTFASVMIAFFGSEVPIYESDLADAEFEALPDQHFDMNEYT